MISIIVPTYNESELLPTLLNSIKAQTYTDYEIIVADNNSTDNTIEIAKSYAATITSGGLPGKGRNCGAAVANGELLLFLDADVILPETFLADIIAEFEAGNYSVATCQIEALSDRKVDYMMHQIYNYFMRATARIHPFAPGFCILVDRNIHNIAGGFDEDILLGEDSEYVQRISKMGSFGVLLSHMIPVSVRRLDRDGRLNVAAKYILAGIYMSVIGDIKSNIFNYTFGHNKRV